MHCLPSDNMDRKFLMIDTFLLTFLWPATIASSIMFVPLSNFCYMFEDDRAKCSASVTNTSR